MILSTSDTKLSREQTIYMSSYLTFSFFCFVFQLIYESFSHGVKSYFMIFAFIIPLIGGCITVFSFPVFKSKFGYLFRQLINGGIVWLTLGCIFQGVLEIYGTTNSLIVIFPVVGIIQLVLAFVIIIVGMILLKKRQITA